MGSRPYQAGECEKLFPFWEKLFRFWEKVSTYLKNSARS